MSTFSERPSQATVELRFHGPAVIQGQVPFDGLAHFTRGLEAAVSWLATASTKESRRRPAPRPASALRAAFRIRAMQPASGTLELTLQSLQASRRDVVRVEQALATVLETIGRVSLGDVPPCTGLDQRTVRCLWQASVILDCGFDRVDLDLRTADRHLQATLDQQVRLRLTECLIQLTRDAGPGADQPDLPDPGEFWKDRTIDELAAEQDVDPSATAESLVGAGRELWEDDREFEAFVRETEESRKEEPDLEEDDA